MFDPKIAQEMAKEFVSSLHPGLASFHAEMESHLRQFLQNSFSKMDLVTRQEFDIQVQVLAKTRLKLEELERVLQKLEKIEDTIRPSQNDI